jgi:hypothetical protein
LRALLGLFEEDDLITVEYHELFVGGYYRYNESLCKANSDHFSRTFRSTESAIVMTEGIADANVIKLTIDTLYPHLSDLFSFLEFSKGDFPHEGGASFIVKMIKVFISGKVGNKIIAVFDNDSAAHEALLDLNIRNLPPNVRVIVLPDIDIASNYPTSGPSGTTLTDINGRASSIELFFGAKVLRGDDGNLTPVTWSSKLRKIGRFQGEIDNKDDLHKKYVGLIKDIKNDPLLLENSGLEDMQRFIRNLIYAFNA